MQYKIPVQIENEDPIIFGLSLRQLIIVMLGFGIAYQVFKGLAPSTGAQIAMIPSVLILLIAIAIAVFKYYEMTFIPFLLATIRFKTNIEERRWIKSVDSFQPIDIGYISTFKGKKENNVDFKEKMDKIKNIDKNLDKI